MTPGEIEHLSFKIIDQEAGHHDFDPRQWKIVQRMIHTSADFDYIKSVRFHEKAVSQGIKAIQSGCTIITDTGMAKAGIRKKEIHLFNGQVHCFISDPDVIKKAKDMKTTRAAAAIDKACAGKDRLIFALGNAPTALIRLLELIKAGKVKPELVVGLPVGFVNAAESKAELMAADIVHISNTGRKGGSNIAASVINALAIMAAEEHRR